LRHEILFKYYIISYHLENYGVFQEKIESDGKIDYHTNKCSLLKESVRLVRWFFTITVDLFIATSLGFRTESWQAWAWWSTTIDVLSSLS